MRGPQVQKGRMAPHRTGAPRPALRQIKRTAAPSRHRQARCLAASSALPSRAMTFPSKLPAGFVVPAQPVASEAPPSGADWVHEIKHDGYRMIVRRDGDSVWLYSRRAIDWTARLPAIAAGAALLKARSFTIDGEAVVVGPDGLTDFEALPHGTAAYRQRCPKTSGLP
jgi:ATP-dependent DNA ligase